MLHTAMFNFMLAASGGTEQWVFLSELRSSPHLCGGGMGSGG